MKNDFTTAPLAPGLRGAGGGTVEKSFTASHTKIQTRPLKIRLANENLSSEKARPAGSVCYLGIATDTVRWHLMP